MTDRYWAHFKSGRKEQKLGPFATRAEAYAAALPYKPKTVSTGRGLESGSFDMQWRDLNYQRDAYQ